MRSGRVGRSVAYFEWHQGKAGKSRCVRIVCACRLQIKTHRNANATHSFLPIKIQYRAMHQSYLISAHSLPRDNLKARYSILPHPVQSE